MNTDIRLVDDSVLPAPAELSEQDLETVAGGATPAALLAIGAVAGAAAAVIGVINHIEEKQLEKWRKEQEAKRAAAEKAAAGGK